MSKKQTEDQRSDPFSTLALVRPEVRSTQVAQMK